MKLKKFLLLFLFFTPHFVNAAPAAPKSPSGQFNPKGVNGSAGFGIIDWTVLEPGTARFRFDQGTFAALSVERGFNFFNLYLTLALGYMRGTGQVNYNYTTLAGTNYQAEDVSFTMELFQAGLGLKLKIIDGYWFRPYVEGGGTGGYFTLRYDNLRQKLPVAQQNDLDYKTNDSLLDFGRYAEGGVEIAFSDMFGIRGAARFIDSETKKLKTLDDKVLRYQAAIYYMALLVNF